MDSLASSTESEAASPAPAAGFAVGVAHPYTDLERAMRHIARVRENERLFTEQSAIDAFLPAFMPEGFRRRLAGESKERNLVHVRLVVQRSCAAIEVLRCCTEAMAAAPTPQNRPVHTVMQHSADTLSGLLNDVWGTLERLKLTTYANDPNICDEIIAVQTLIKPCANPRNPRRSVSQ
jgi:hypothetical protein